MPEACGKCLGGVISFGSPSLYLCELGTLCWHKREALTALGAGLLSRLAVAALLGIPTHGALSGVFEAFGRMHINALFKARLCLCTADSGSLLQLDRPNCFCGFRPRPYWYRLRVLHHTSGPQEDRARAAQPVHRRLFAAPMCNSLLDERQLQTVREVEACGAARHVAED